jgi:glycerol-3-phosphate dehydrogenase subunit B
MEAIGATTTPAQNGTAGQVQWVESKTSARPLKNQAKAFLLATGGIMGGGLISDHLGRVWEVVFDLPLTVPQQRSEWFRPAFLDPQGHPVFDGGVRVNRSFQPVDAAGKPLYANLWAAGDLLANDNPILQRSMEGSAIATGFAAARAIVEG